MEKKLTPRELKRIESDKRIIDATIDIMGKKGYMNSNLREIAAAAGITQGLISQRFETKENLLIQAIIATNTVWRDYVIPDDMPAEELLMRIIDAAKRLYLQNEKVFRFIYTISSSIDVPAGVLKRQREYFCNSGLYRVLKKAQNTGFLPEGDLASLYNIFLCNTMRLIRDYNRLGMAMPEDKFFFAAIQYRNPVAEEHEYLRSKAFESVSQSFDSLIYFYIHSGAFRISRTYEIIEKYSTEESDGQSLLNRCCRELIDENNQKEVYEFIDLSTATKRMGDKKLIAIECAATDKCRYRLSFIFIEKAENKEIILFGVRKLGN